MQKNQQIFSFEVNIAFLLQPDIRRNSKGGAQGHERDYISYTVSAPSGRGTAMFSADGMN